MRKNRIPSPSSGEDILGARLNDVKKDITALGEGTTTLTSDPNVSPESGLRRYIIPAWDFATGGEPRGELAVVANQVRCYRFVLTETISDISTISYDVSQDAVGATAVFGLYSSDGEKLCEWALTATGFGAHLSAALADPVTLEPDDYWLAWSCDDITVLVWLCGSSGTNAVRWASVLNARDARLGDAANPMVGLVLPSSLGVVTANNTLQPPMVCLNTIEN